MKILAMTSLLLLGTMVMSVACTSTATQEPPEPAEPVVRNDADEPTIQPDRRPPTLINTLMPEEMPEGVSPDLARDARMYAAQHNVELSEATTRLLLRDSADELEADLFSNEADTFGGLWIQHEPEFRVVVTFTNDGKQTIAEYVKDDALGLLKKSVQEQVHAALGLKWAGSP